ncbi:MAG: hypothetical protein WCN98_18780, partial [Verrucomicrobiaceae bacterium]
MKTIILLAFVTLLSGLRFAAADSTNDELRKHPDLTPEKCAAQEPYRMFEERSEALRAETGSSEQSQTRFLEVYALNLRTWTDFKRPKSKVTRLHIKNAFYEAMHFIVFDIWGGRIHVMPRFPATVNWIVWRGFDNDFKGLTNEESRYRHEDIREFFKII